MQLKCVWLHMYVYKSIGMIFCVRNTEQEKGLDAQDRNDRDGNTVRQTGLEVQF